MSTFSGINLASRALSAANKAVDVTGQNIANANTDGYSRQRVEQTELSTVSDGLFAGRNNVGQGVDVTSISRATDAFVDARQRGDHSTAAYADQTAGVYGDVDHLLNEPADDGLTEQLNSFWGSWKDLANDSSDAAAQAEVFHSGQTVASTVNTLDTRLATQWSNLHDSASTLTDQVNTTTAKIAQLNLSIAKASNTGQNANELLDQRDGFVLKLADLTGATTTARADGTVDVSIGGSTVVHGSDSVRIQVSGTPTTLRGVSSSSQVTLSLVGSGSPVRLNTGKLGGVLDGLNTVLPGVAQQFDATAQSVATAVNGLYNKTSPHVASGDFFGTSDGSGVVTAQNLAVAVPNAAAIAGSTTGTKDGRTAAALGALSESTSGPNSVWRNQVTDIAQKVATANTTSSVASTTALNSDASRESVSGVNIDEEMVNLVTYQHAYSSAAKVFTAMDDMLGTLINMVR